MGFRDKDNIEFLHQYMTLTRCDLLFADKAILIEGTTERLLMPKMVQKVEANLSGMPLSSQYISYMEVGGAYAHIFFKLLDFLAIPTLIITDIDAIDSDRKACKVSKGERTSNSCITAWFSNPNVSPEALLAKSGADKIQQNRRIAYQVPEDHRNPCGRSFEDAFILANGDMFGLGVASSVEAEDEAWRQAHEKRKSAFALEMALSPSEWRVPRYIQEGLTWLADPNASLIDSVGHQDAAAVDLAGEPLS